MLGTAAVFPLFGLVLGVIWFAPSIAVGAAVSGVEVCARGRISAAGFAGASIVATSFFVWSWLVTPPAIDDVSGELLEGPDVSMLVGGSALLIASLYAGWWIHRRRLRGREARLVS